MAVYNASGRLLTALYESSGEELEEAYNNDGDLVYEKGIPLTVMAFNVGCFYSEYHPAPSGSGLDFFFRHKGIFEKYKPDFAGLSEWYNIIDDIPSAVLMKEDFKTYYPDFTMYASENAALTSAFSGTPSSVALIEYATQDSGTRYYQKSYITFGGKTICCILTHLALTANVREAQFNELLSAVENEEYFIVAGDFNFEIVQANDSEYEASIDLILDAGYNSAQNGSNIYKTWLNGKTGTATTQYALDNIFTSPNIVIKDVIRDETKLTDGLNTQYNVIIDHLPLVAHVLVR